MMNRIIAFLLSLVVTIGVQAQSHSNKIGFGTGIMYPQSWDATLSWEHETLYHNAWEYFVNGNLKWTECASCDHICPESFWHNYCTWGIGIAYKPCINRGRNHYGALRIGGSAGSNTQNILGGIHIGYEHNYALRHGWGLYWQVKCDVMLPKREDLFRSGFTLGIKIPTTKQ